MTQQTFKVTFDKPHKRKFALIKLKGKGLVSIEQDGFIVTGATTSKRRYLYATIGFLTGVTLFGYYSILEGVKMDVFAFICIILGILLYSVLKLCPLKKGPVVHHKHRWSNLANIESDSGLTRIILQDSKPRGFYCIKSNYALEQLLIQGMKTHDK